MPKIPKPQKSSIIRRIFGDPVSDSTEESIPGIRGAWMARQIERPDLEGSVNNIRPMSMFNKWRYPDATGHTNMFGGISLNPDEIKRQGADINDVLVHEMTHAKQGGGGFLRRLYNPSQIDDEFDAVKSEALRKVRKTDIPLRSPN